MFPADFGFLGVSDSDDELDLSGLSTAESKIPEAKPETDPVQASSEESLEDERESALEDVYVQILNKCEQLSLNSQMVFKAHMKALPRLEEMNINAQVFLMQFLDEKGAACNQLTAEEFIKNYLNEVSSLFEAQQED